MDVYVGSLTVLILLVIAAAYWKSNQDNEESLLFSVIDDHQLEILDAEIHDIDCENTADRYHNFRVQFLTVFGLAVAADWLQGSFMYSLYKHKYELPETTIATLFATGFLCGGLSAIFVGALADKYGRKQACLWYCGLYSVSCMSVTSSKVTILFLGRILGGVSTTLLFTVFEAWMIAEYHRLGVGNSDTALSSVYSSMSILNGFVAVASGVGSQYLVYVFGSEVAPFMASILCLSLAAFLIYGNWTENSGRQPLKTNATWTPRTATRTDAKTLFAIGMTICFLEGSMYIMVYSWSQALSSARDLAFDWGRGKPPFGLIFANFMCALTLGSFFFTYLTRRGNSVRLSSSTVQAATASASFCLLLTVWAAGESPRFWSFCVFEFCLGIYFPSMAFLKGALISDAQRAKVYGLMRVPLNVFAVLALVTIEEGDASRENRFMFCSGMLTLSVLFMAKYVPR